MKDALKYNVLYRSTVIVWMVMKFMVQIYFFHVRHSIWDEATKEKWDKLLVKQAREYRFKAVRLGGVLIKVGQFLSTRTDFMPDAFIRELTGLVDRVPSMSFAYAKNLLEKEWVSPIEQHLLEIEESSIASASIGEVYRAKLKDGTDVAIKVQRYRIEEIFRKDFKALRVVFWILSVFTAFGKKADLKELYRELITVMNRELDFQQELKFGNYFKERLKDYDQVHVPTYYEPLSTKKVIVMEWIDGVKVTDLSFINRHNLNAQRIAKTLFDVYLDQFMHPGYFHADPHAGNVLIQPDGIIAIIDFGMISEVRKQDVHLFKQLIRSIIIDDYDKVIETLDEMKFILPNSNKKKLKKMIKQTLDLYKNGSIKNMDAHAMDQIKDDIRIFIKDQPIQLSADYAYLGRAISIIVGILFDLYPDIDIEKWAKPKIKQWFGGKVLLETIYKQVAKDAVQPLLSLPKSMINWLGNGEKDRQWDKEKHSEQLKHQFYLFMEMITFIMMIIGIGFSVYGHLLNEMILTISALSLTILFFIILNIILIKHYRMIRTTIKGGVGDE